MFLMFKNQLTSNFQKWFKKELCEQIVSFWKVPNCGTGQGFIYLSNLISCPSYHRWHFFGSQNFKFTEVHYVVVCSWGATLWSAYGQFQVLSFSGEGFQVVDPFGGLFSYIDCSSGSPTRKLRNHDKTVASLFCCHPPNNWYSDDATSDLEEA